MVSQQPLFLSLIAYAQILRHDFSNALATIEQGLAVERKQDLVALAGVAYARIGYRTQAVERLDELNMVEKRAYLQPYFVARVHAALGDKPKVWKWLKKAVEERSEWLVHADMGGLRTDPAWDDLREEPEFKELLKKVGLDAWPGEAGKVAQASRLHRERNLAGELTRCSRDGCATLADRLLVTPVFQPARLPARKPAIRPQGRGSPIPRPASSPQPHFAGIAL